MRIITRIIILAGCLVLLLASPSLGAAEDDGKLEAINKEIGVIDARLATLKKSEKSLLNDIYGIELRYEKALIENNKVKLQLRNTNQQINQKSSEKKLLEQEIVKSRKNLEKILRILYKIGGNAYLKLFVQIDSLDQLFKNYRLFESLISNQSDELEKLKKNILSLNRVNRELQTSYTSLQELQQEKQAKVRSIQRLKRNKLNLVRKINNDRKEFLKMRDELRDEAARLNLLISGEEIKHTMKTLDLKKIKGKLRWPIRGKVVSSFGRKRSTKFNTYILNNGIKIKPGDSSNVRAVYAGEVVFANYFKGYGNLIIVQHSNNFYSLYGHCEKFFKNKGDSVREGEMISIAGDSGSTSGKVLHFEIRSGSSAENPLRWLRKRR